jgi:hypothetical protein
MMKSISISKNQLAYSSAAIFCLSSVNIGYAHPPVYCAAVTLPNGQSGFMGHPCPQQRPGPSIQTTSGDTTIVVTPEGQNETQNPFDVPPGSNFLMTKYQNLRDFNGHEMPNTLPSTEDGRYNLHDGPVLIQAINKASPSDDLKRIIERIEKTAKRGRRVRERLIQRGIDILEGNPIPNRAYSGFPMLHYNGPNKIKKVKPICAAGPCSEPLQPADVVIGGNVDVELIYWDQHIEGNTAFVDPSDVQDVPWTITYHVNILHGGIEDFSPMVMHFDQNPDGTRGPMAASMDQTYFPMLEEGTRYTVKIKQSLGKYYNLTYIWGWRIHPPRVQVIENALKAPGGITLPQYEINVFGEAPRDSEENKLAAIGMIGDIAPAKKMWNIFRKMSRKTDTNDLNSNRHQYFHKVAHKLAHRFDYPSLDEYVHGHQHGNKNRQKKLKTLAADLKAAFLDWSDRTKLPAGVKPDPNATITLLYANNTIYGSRQGLQGEGSGQGPASFKGICNGCAHDWNIRPYVYKVTLYNGDHFPHGYMNVDFGGSRGWENQFQFTDPTTVQAAYDHDDPSLIIGRHTDIVNGEVIDSDSDINIIEDDLLLDNTVNPAKTELARDLSTGELVYTKDKIFPMNTGGTEEFLQPSPRNLDINEDPQLGSGCYFTFGRNYAWPNAGGPWGSIMVPAVADDGTLGMHKVEITFNYEPSRRLRIYQFDPLHHDVAVYSLH